MTKRKFTIRGIGDVRIAMDVVVEAPAEVLGRKEVIDLKYKLENDLHGILRTRGYDVKDIRIKG